MVQNRFDEKAGCRECVFRVRCGQNEEPANGAQWRGVFGTAERVGGRFSVEGGFICLRFFYPFAGASCSAGPRGRLLWRGGRGVCRGVLFLWRLLGGL